MKRFITYVYEYCGGKKQGNVGFVRVDWKEDVVHLVLHLRYFRNQPCKGNVYALLRGEPLVGVPLEKLVLGAGVCERELSFAAESIMDTGVGFDDVVGILIAGDRQVYLASCWTDEVAEEIAHGEYRVWRSDIQENPLGVSKEVLRDIPDAQDTVVRVEETKEMDVIMQEKEVKGTAIVVKEAGEPETEDLVQEELHEAELPMVTYQKIELNEIRLLPRRNWRLLSNRFLIHGFFNYGYLVVATETSDGVEKAYLGVPGVYEKPESTVAAVFDFAFFRELPPEVSSAKMEERVTTAKIKDHNPKEGTFGLWMKPLYI